MSLFPPEDLSERSKRACREPKEVATVKGEMIKWRNTGQPMLFDALHAHASLGAARFFQILAEAHASAQGLERAPRHWSTSLILDDGSFVFSMGLFGWLYPHQFTVSVPQRLRNASHATAPPPHEIIVASHPLDGGVTHAK